MSGRAGIGPERLAELVDGAGPADEDERAMLALIAETRALEPPASDGVRRRLLEAAGADAADEAAGEGAPGRLGRALGGLDPRRWARGGGAGRRRGLMVAAPVAAALLALVVAIPALDGGGTDATSPLPAAPAREGGGPAPASDAAGDPAPSVVGTTADPQSPPPVTAPTPGPVTDPSRLQRVRAWTRVRVDDVDALSRASTSAMRTVRRLGGYTASSQYGVPDGGRGTNALVMRVPAGRVEEALTAFGRLGTVIGQRAEITDVTDRVAAGDRRVARLTEDLAELRARAAAEPGDAALARRVARAEAALERARSAVAAQRRAARLATVELTLTTEGPPAPPAEEGRFAGPISDAGDRLASALAWLLGALILAAPFAALAAGAWWGARRARARAARRLMGSA